MAPRVGIEPTTRRLTVVCSTAELPGNRAGLTKGADSQVLGSAASRNRAHKWMSALPPGLPPADHERVGHHVERQQEPRQQPLDVPGEPRRIKHPHQVVSEKPLSVSGLPGKLPPVILERGQ